ncbi:MAG: DUF11 domain-containing protein [Fusobacteriaceae bacterium]
MRNKILVIISVLFFYCLNIFASEISVNNTATYTVNGSDNFFSNSVTTMVMYKMIDFGEHEENKPEQNLGEDGLVYLHAILKMKNTADERFFFRSNYSNKVYAEDAKFVVFDLVTGEKIELQNNPENNSESVSMIFKNNRSYLIFFAASQLKNTMNLKSSLFSIDLLSEKDNMILGSVQNTLYIDNHLKLTEHEDNIYEQELSKDKSLKIIGELDIKNILKEEIYFTADLGNNVKFYDVYLKFDDKSIKLEYDEKTKKYYSENLILQGIKKIELDIKNPEYLGDNEKGEISLEVNNNGNKHGEIINKIIYKKDKKIMIEKISKSKTASIGDLVKYEVIIKNSIDEKFSEIVFSDFLPKGMSFLKESVKVSNGLILKEVSDENANRVNIALNVQNSQRSVETEKISYLARVNMNAKDGKNINRVIAVGKTIFGQNFSSNMATAEVKIDKDNFYDKGIIFGRIYFDKDNDGLYKEKLDIPVSGVKVFLENGDFAITDRYGKYSIYGVEAVTHITKIYEHTLPLGLKTKKNSNLHSENGDSRFVDLKKAQLDRSDFALTLDGTRDLEFIEKIIKKRYEKLAEDNYELDRVIDGKFLDAKKSSSKVELSNEKGVINSGKELDIDGIRNSVLYGDIETKVKEFKKEKTLIEEWNLIPDYNLEASIKEFDNSIDIVNVKNGDIVPEYMSFQIKGPGEGTLKLFANNKEISPSKISLTAKSSANNLFFLEYTSIKLEQGKTKLKVSYHDTSGIERFKKEIEVFVRGKYKKVILEMTDSNENTSLKNIIIKGVDEYNSLIDHSLSVNIEASKGRFVTNEGVSESSIDLVTNINGYGEIKYKPNPGKNKVLFKIEAEGKKSQIELDIEGDKSDFFLNGILEGRYNFNKNRDVNFFFEKEIDSYKNSFFYRGAVYGEGNISDLGYLTLTYDTHKDDEDKFFSYKDPEDYYPIFGDNSTKGYVGKSKENLYLRFDRNRSYLLYGDYKTGELLDQRLKLGKFNRTLTGGILKYEDDNFLVTGFLAETANLKYSEELKGDGVSGPYKLSKKDIIPGSETVTVVVNDRITGIELLQKKLILGEDYTLEYDFGRLYFSEPLPSTDLEFNPITIKISYEIESSDGEKSIVYGGEASYKLTENILLGTSHFKDTRATENKEINNIHGIYESENFSFVAEHSFTKDELDEKGDAISLATKYEKNKIKTELIYEKSNLKYKNEDSNVESGIHRAKLKTEYSLETAGKLSLTSTAQERENDNQTSEIKIDSYLGYESEWFKNLKYEIGVHQYFKDTDVKTEKNYSLGNRLTWQGLDNNKLKLFVEHEQGLEDKASRRLAIGSDYTLFEKTSLYTRHELISNLGDFYYLDGNEKSNQTIAGIKTNFLETEVYSEYREKKTDSLPLPEMAYGVKRSFKPVENLELFGTFEKVSPLTKKAKEEINFTFGYDYETLKIGRLRGEFEFEFEDESSFLNKMSYGKKINKSNHLILKNRYFESGNEKENRFLVGFAHRDAKNNSYHSLNKYELNYSKNIVHDDHKQLTHIFRSSHNFQDDLDFEKTLTLAVKNSKTNYEGISENYYSYLITGNLNYDVLEKWTTGINLGVLFDNKKNVDYGLGFEVGHVFENNLWISAGYNFVGFKDKDFDPTGDLDKGLYIRFRMNIGDYF